MSVFEIIVHSLIQHLYFWLFDKVLLFLKNKAYNFSILIWPKLEMDVICLTYTTTFFMFIKQSGRCNELQTSDSS